MTATLSDLLDQVSALVGGRTLDRQRYLDWATGTPTGGPNGDGRYPLVTLGDATPLLPCPAKAAADAAPRGPEQFGAIGDGASHPANFAFATLADCQAVYPFASSLSQELDFLAWQKMINTAGEFVCPSPPRTYKMCNGAAASMTPLNWVAGVSDVDLSHGTLDWTDLRQQTSDAHFVEAHDFASPGSWRNSTLYTEPGTHTDATFDSGAAVMIDDHDGHSAGFTGNPYYEWGAPINPPPGTYRVTIEGTVTRGQSFHHGNLNPPYCYVNFNGYAVGQGGWDVSNRYASINPGLDPTNPETTPVPFSGTFTFIVTQQKPGFLVFKGGGYANFRVTRLDITPFIANCGILMNRDGSPAHYFKHKRLRRGYVTGPPPAENNWTGLTGILWKSFSDLDGDLQDLEGVRIFGWDHAVAFSDGAYLISCWDCDILGEGHAVYADPGSANAGENIKFYSGVISAGTYIINNIGNMEFTLFGTATDYPGKGLCCNNGGTIRLIGCHHEQPAARGNYPIWHCTTGRVIYEASVILIAGGVGTAPVPPMQLDTSNSGIELHSTDVYNISSASGLVVSGAGTLTTFGLLNSGNPNIGNELISTNDNADILGGAGQFEDNPGEVYFANQDKTGIFLEGGLFSDHPGTDNVAIDRWNSTLTRISRSTDYAYSGTKSLKIEKTGPLDNNTADEIQILIPIRSAGNIMSRMFFLFPNPVTDPAVTPQAYPFGPLVYFRQFFVQVIGHDALGRPIYSHRAKFKGEATIRVPMAGSKDWIKRAPSTLYAPTSPDGGEGTRSPPWATHYMIALNLQSIPATTFYLDNLIANFLG